MKLNFIDSNLLIEAVRELCAQECFPNKLVEKKNIGFNSPRNGLKFYIRDTLSEFNCKEVKTGQNLLVDIIPSVSIVHQHTELFSITQRIRRLGNCPTTN